MNLIQKYAVCGSRYKLRKFVSFSDDSEFAAHFVSHRVFTYKARRTWRHRAAGDESIFHVIFPPYGSWASSKAPPVFFSETSSKTLSEGRQTEPEAVLPSENTFNSIFDQSIWPVD